jgi:hypothetical protein
MISPGVHSVPEPVCRFDAQLRWAAHLLPGSFLLLPHAGNRSGESSRERLLA